MVSNYARNGVYLAGLAVNTANPKKLSVAKSFAKLTNTRILGVILPDAAVSKAEHKHRTVMTAYPKSDFSRRVAYLCSTIMTVRKPITDPRAMSDAEFFAFSENHSIVSLGEINQKKKKSPAKKEIKSPASLFKLAGLEPRGIEDGQILCDWTPPEGVFKVLIAPVSKFHKNLIGFSDWEIFFQTTEPSSETLGVKLRHSAERLSPLNFNEMFSAFIETKDFYERIPLLCGPADRELRKHTDISFKKWQPFIFPQSTAASSPPGSISVEYSDSECRFSACEGGMLGMINAGPNFSAKRPHTPPLPMSDARSDIVELNINDIVFGNNRKMLGLLRRAAKQTGPNGLLILYIGCLPLMLSTDIDAVIHKVEKEKGVKIVFENNSGVRDINQIAAYVNFMANKLSRPKHEKT